MAQNVAIYDIIIRNAKAIQSMSTLNSQTNKFEDSVKGANREGSNTGKSFSSTKMLAFAASAGIVGGTLLSVIKKNAMFEKQMSAVKAVTNSSAGEMEVLTKAAQDMGASTEFTAFQAAQGLEFLGKAGLNASQSVASLPSVLNLASAAGMDLGRTADIATNIMTQFGLKASDSEKIVDILSYTVNSSNQNLEQMADAMNFLGPTAKALGIPLKDAAAFTGMMAKSGLQGSLGTRAFGTALVKLADPTKKMRAKMEELGLEVFNSEGKFIGLGNLLSTLDKKYATLTEQQKLAATAALFNTEAVQEVSSALALGGDALDIYATKIEELGTGATSKAANERLNNLAGDVTKLSSAFDAMLHQAGPMNTMFRSIIQLTTESVKGLSHMGTLFENIFRKKGIENASKEMLDLFFIEGKLGKDNKTQVSDLIRPFKQLTSEQLDSDENFNKFYETFRDAGASDKSIGVLFRRFQASQKENEELIKAGQTNVKPQQSTISSAKTADPANPTASATSASQSRSLQGGATGAKSGKVQNINITIDKLVENLNINQDSTVSGIADIADKVAKVLLTAVNDVNLVAG